MDQCRLALPYRGRARIGRCRRHQHPALSASGRVRMAGSAHLWYCPRRELRSGPWAKGRLMRRAGCIRGVVPVEAHFARCGNRATVQSNLVCLTSGSGPATIRSLASERLNPHAKVEAGKRTLPGPYRGTFAPSLRAEPITDCGPEWPGWCCAIALSAEAGRFCPSCYSIGQDRTCDRCFLPGLVAI